MEMEMIIEQMKKISLSEDPLPMLMDMKSSLAAIPNRNVSKLENSCPLTTIQPLFDVLNSNNNEQITTCVDVLNYILMKITPKVALENFINQYLLCLSHPHEKVRLLILKQILIGSENEEAAQSLLAYPALLRTVATGLTDSNMEVVKISINSLVNLCKFPNSANKVFSSENLEALTIVMKSSDSCRFYVYDLAVKVCLLNDDFLQLMMSSGILSQLLGEVSGRDILTQLNALELLSELASSQRGLKYLKMDGIVSKFSYLLVTAKNDPLAAILLPGLLKFFGHLGAVYPHVLAEEETMALREIMRISSDFSGSTEPTLQLIAFETLAHIGHSVEGKNTLKKFRVEMEQSIKDFSTHFSSFQSEMKVRILESFAKLFFVHIDEQTEDLLCLLETWFEHLSDKSSVNFIFRVARQPFPDILCASLTLLQSLINLPWGLKHVLSEPGLVEWLLNRDSCKDKGSKELRYDVIATIHRRNEVARSFLDEETQRNIETFVHQGPFYVDSELSVAFEKQN